MDWPLALYGLAAPVPWERKLAMLQLVVHGLGITSGRLRQGDWGAVKCRCTGEEPFTRGCGGIEPRTGHSALTLLLQY